MLIRWFGQRREAAFLAQCDAEALVFTNGRDAYAEARRRERETLFRARELRDKRRDRRHWRRVASLLAHHAG